jgi:hypothetical protein
MYASDDAYFDRDVVVIILENVSGMYGCQTPTYEAYRLKKHCMIRPATAVVTPTFVPEPFRVSRGRGLHDKRPQRPQYTWYKKLWSSCCIAPRNFRRQPYTSSGALDVRPHLDRSSVVISCRSLAGCYE